MDQSFITDLILDDKTLKFRPTFVTPKLGEQDDTPLLCVCNDPSHQDYTFSTYLRLMREDKSLSAMEIATMAGLTPGPIMEAETLSWEKGPEDWHRLIVGIAEKNLAKPLRTGKIKGLDLKGRMLEKGKLATPFQPIPAPKKGKKSKPAPVPSPLLQRLLRKTHD
jgi:hypothetical protein